MVYVTKENKDLIVTCKCGCEEGFHISVDQDADEFAIISCISGNYYREQYGVFGTLGRKLRHIWAVIRNREFICSEILLTKDEFEQYKDWINQKWEENCHETV